MYLPIDTYLNDVFTLVILDMIFCLQNHFFPRLFLNTITVHKLKPIGGAFSGLFPQTPGQWHPMFKSSWGSLTLIPAASRLSKERNVCYGFVKRLHASMAEKVLIVGLILLLLAKILSHDTQAALSILSYHYRGMSIKSLCYGVMCTVHYKLAPSVEAFCMFQVLLMFDFCFVCPNFIFQVLKHFI